MNRTVEKLGRAGEARLLRHDTFETTPRGDLEQDFDVPTVVRRRSMAFCEVGTLAAQTPFGVPGAVRW